MKLLHFLTLITLLTTSLFAKPHEGSFKFMDLQKAKNSFDTTIEVKYNIDTLMGYPVVKAKAKYDIMGLVNIEGTDRDLSKKQLDKIKIYNLKVKVPFQTDSVHRLLWIEIDMGVMGKHGEWSFNTPSSPNWNKWIMGEGGYLNKKEAIKAYKGFQRLGVSSGLGSLAMAETIKFNVTAMKRYFRKQKIESEKERLKEENAVKTDGLKKEIEKIYELDKKIVTRLEKRYEDKNLYAVMQKLEKENNKEELAYFMKELEASEKLLLKQKPFQEKINRITEKQNKIEKKLEDEHAYALLEIDKELKDINRFIDEKREEVENRKLLQKSKADDDVWIDEESGLMWQDEVYSQREIDNYVKHYKKGKNIGKTGSWYHAKEYCQSLTLNDFSDWRLPSIDELDGVKDKRSNFKSEKQFRGVWSSSSKGNKIFIYSFIDYDKDDKVKWIKDKSIIELVRCVRKSN